jgi:nucleoside triphosphate diphosphatase
LADLDAEVSELRTEPSAEELGDVLFAAVNVARHLGADPELELRRASERFVGRVERAAELAAADGREFRALELDEQDRWFDLAKERERSDG